MGCSGAERPSRTHGSPRDDRPREPLESYRRILQEEIALADAELSRPSSAMAASGVLAGLGVCVSILLIAMLEAAAPPGLPEMARLFFIGNAYAAGSWS